MIRLPCQVRSILTSYSGIFFLNDPVAGGLLLLCTILCPNIGISALICAVAAYGFARLLGLKDDFLRLDFYIYNPLLVGLSIGYFFRLGPLSILFLVLMGIGTFVLTYSLYNIFYYYFRLPVLSLPFVLGSLVATLASYRFSNLFVENLYFHLPSPAWQLPLWLKGFLISFGAIFFMPNVQCGLYLFLVLLLASRILAFLAVLGYFAGTLLAALFTGSTWEAFSDPGHFNFILIAMALGGVFLIPSPRSYLMAVLATLSAFPLMESSRVFWHKFGLPAFALPFNLTVLFFLYTLKLAGFRGLTQLYRGNPERTLDYYLSLNRRFPSQCWDIGLPVMGRWTVWQGERGEYTHKGPWQHALDFVVEDEERKTFVGDGARLEDYYAYRKPIFSPVTGRVVDLVDDLPDEAPGRANTDQPWGNYVIIHDERGFYCLMAHFSPGSFRVKKGEWVVQGAMIGLCGSSGYAPQPHLHIHLQLVEAKGGQSIPFVFSAYLRDGEFVDYSLPKEGEVVEPLTPDMSMKRGLNFLLGQEFLYDVWEDGERRDPLRVEVAMAPDGTFYLTDGAAKLYFGQRGGAFYLLNYEGPTGSHLRWWFVALAKIPLSLARGRRWRDLLPLETILSPVEKALYLFIGSFWPPLIEARVEYGAVDGFDFRGEIDFNGKRIHTRVRLGPQNGFEEIEVTQGKVKYLFRRRERDEEDVD